MRAKFRGKHHLIQTDETLWIYGCNDWGEIVDENDDHWRVDESTIGQYIGLKDKNGTEIYEGDVLEIQTKDFSYDAVVVYVSDLASFFVSTEQKEYISFTDIVFTIDDGGSIIVIGNVFDDPKLKERFWTVWNRENNEKSNE